MIEVGCAIIIEKGRVLATRRSATMPHPLKWEFPGGKLKAGESPEACVEREIMEELGLKIEAQQLWSPVIHRYDTQTIKLFPVSCRILDGLIILSEHQEYRWVPGDELAGLDWLEADIDLVEKIRTELCDK